jgi:hypothetical protein
MPYSGLCLNKGRVWISQKQERPRHFRPPMHGNANHDAIPFQPRPPCDVDHGGNPGTDGTIPQLELGPNGSEIRGQTGPTLYGKSKPWLCWSFSRISASVLSASNRGPMVRDLCFPKVPVPVWSRIPTNSRVDLEWPRKRGNKDDVRSASHRFRWTVDSELAYFCQILPDDNQRSSRSA